MRRPNLLILYTDQQRWDALGANGNPDIHTPNLDRLAGQALNFRNCFVQNPLCMPSRASFLTGQYPGTLGITHMGVPLPEDAPTLPRLLRNYGYRSTNIGKLHFLPHANRDHRAPHPSYGFDQLEISDEPGCYEDAYRAWVRAKDPAALPSVSCGLPPAREDWHRIMGTVDTVSHPAGGRGEHRTRAFGADSALTHSAFVTERTIDCLRAAARRPDEPFLLIAGYFSPHSPWIAPREDLDLYDPTTFTLPPRTQWGDRTEDELRQAHHGYYAMVTEVDRHVGRILAALDDLEMTGDTAIVFTSDHGEWLGAQGGRFGKGYPADDAVSRVPLLLRLPETAGTAAAPTGQPRAVERIVEALDVVPTLLEMANIPAPEHLQSRSLLSGGGPGSDDHSGSALTEGSGWKALRTEGFRYLVHADGTERLFDISKDPDEATDVALDPASGAILAEQRRLLLARLIDRERPLPRVWSY